MKNILDAPFWDRGFRPFFLLGAAYAVFMIVAWVGVFGGFFRIPVAWNDPTMWHAHEMIFGFTLAIIAGFLLTAVSNWTGGAPTRRGYLMLLCGVWLAGRLSFWWGYAPQPVLSFIDLSFIPLLGICLAIPLIRAKNHHNLSFIGVLTLLFLCDLNMHLIALGLVKGDPRITAYTAVLVVLMIVSIVSSRIIPSFTVAGLRQRGLTLFQTDQTKTDITAMLLLFALAVAVFLTGLKSMPTALCALAAGLIHLWRMRHWHSLKTSGEPMLWILHAGHFWLVAGLLSLGLHALGLVTFASLALHMLTVGCIGSLTLGMMARVSLGHTGRLIRTNAAMVLAFLMMQWAAILRCLAIMVGSNHYLSWIMVTGIFWVAAYSLYLVIYTPILFGPRADRG